MDWNFVHLFFGCTPGLAEGVAEKLGKRVIFSSCQHFLRREDFCLGCGREDLTCPGRPDIGRHRCSPGATGKTEVSVSLKVLCQEPQSHVGTHPQEE